MGHCEMLLAVAGLDADSLLQRTRLLAGRDWSDLAPEDRYAFFFAIKQARQPWSLNRDDFAGLQNHFGPQRALDVVWWACRCHYMTRVADAFQLPLERENVFAD